MLGTIPLSWPYRVLLVTTLVFFLPSVSMGTVSPVVAKLAVDRLRRFKRTGTAIGQVYAWGMVGSILGTFLTGFYLIDLIGTKGVLLILGTVMAFAATVLGSVWHAVWAGVPLGLCVVAFLPLGMFQKMGEDWGIREEQGDPASNEEGFAWIDESKYYFIKVTNEPELDNGPPAPHPGARQPDSRLFRARPSRAARLRLRAYLCPGGLPGRQGQRQDHAGAGQPTDDQAVDGQGPSDPARPGLRRR